MSSASTKITITKFIRARRERVFEAWVNPDLVKEWFAPGIDSVASMTRDLKPGGAYRIAMKGSMMGNSYDIATCGKFEKIILNELLSYTWTYEDEVRKSSVGDSLVTVQFRDVDGGTEITLTHERFATEERRKGHEFGWNDTLAKLQSMLER